ncbi:unnamed protein product [Enterobius vermicularis]|uniref:Uncharacterized protein n=1 Tax=Enterobius vermicularis TaxID=51028 RepID=A0A0N4VPQ3_ENTVE|nr:unnamed protein product [Enterobius vermicularis]
MQLRMCHVLGDPIPCVILKEHPFGKMQSSMMASICSTDKQLDPSPRLYGIISSGQIVVLFQEQNHFRATRQFIVR